MLKWIETTGRSEEDAIAAALFQLGLDRDDVSVEVIERAKSGFFGFGSNPAKVRVSYEAPDETGGAQEAQPKPAAPAAPEKPAAEEAKPAAPVQTAKPAPAAQTEQPVSQAEESNRLQPGDEVLIGEESAAPVQEGGGSL